PHLREPRRRAGVVRLAHLYRPSHRCLRLAAHPEGRPPGTAGHGNPCGPEPAGLDERAIDVGPYLAGRDPECGPQTLPTDAGPDDEPPVGEAVENGPVVGKAGRVPCGE